MTDRDPELVDAATTWLTHLGDALAARDAGALDRLFREDACWRDLLAFSWDNRQFHNRADVVAALLGAADDSEPHDFSLFDDFRGPRRADLLGEPVVEFYFSLKTATSSSRGYVAAVQDEAGGLQCAILGTCLTELVDGPPRSLTDRRPDLGFTAQYAGQTWAEYRAWEIDYADRDPEVLIVGGGQAGATVAAQLAMHGIDTLVVDRHERPGDSWRLRYESLAHHTPTDMSDFPYFPFPKTFPRYLPKDKYADYLESYVRLMDLNYWTSSTFVGGEFDEQSLTWTATVQRGEEVRVLHPRHIVVAAGGAGGRPRMPAIPGLDTFSGTAIHATAFRSARDYEGSRALVIGVGTTAHDIALDLHHHDCDVVMVQRGSISVVDVEVANVLFDDYTRGEMSQPEADLRGVSRTILPLQLRTLRKYTEWTTEVNGELQKRLADRGMLLDDGEDGTGWAMKFNRYAGGYYLNVGASEFVADGKIRLMQYDEIAEVVPSGVRLTDGSIMELDLIILATGYENLSSDVRDLFGDDLARAVGPIGGQGPDGERMNFCRVTPAPHLWFTFGGIIEGRRYGHMLVHQIQANLLGIVPTLVRGSDGRVRPLA